jgi:hypothetical protein
MTKLTKTQTITLSAGAQRPDNIALPLPKGLHGAAAKMTIAKMIEHDWLQEVDANLRRGEGRLNSKGRAVASKSKTGRGVATVPIFLLVPQVKLRKRLDLARDAERAVDGVPGLIVAKWDSQRL